MFLRERNLIKIERIRTADDNPVIYSIALFPKKFLSSGNKILSIEDLEKYFKQEQSLLDVMENYLDHEIEYTVARLEPLLADDFISKKLPIKIGGVLVCLEQVDYEITGLPLIASNEYHIAEASIFTIFRKR